MKCWRGDKVKTLQVEIGEKKIIHGLLPQQIEELMEVLTLPNPAYSNAEKFAKSPWALKYIPKYLHYYKRIDEDSLEVPFRFNVPYDHVVIRDERVKVRVDYPKMKLKLRTDQKKALLSYLFHPENGILLLPTGAGKTILGLAIAGVLKQKALIITHRSDFIKTWMDDACKLYGFNPNEIGLIQGGKFFIGEQITLATVQTLSKRQLKDIRDIFGMIIMDETHHCPAATYESVLSQFRAFYRVGLTATLHRKDGLTPVVSWYFGDVGYQKSESKDIMPVEVRLIDTRFTAKKIRIETKYGVEWANPTPEELLRQLIRDKERNNFIMKFIEGSVRQGNNCLVLTHRREHAEYLYEELKNRGISVALLIGDVMNRDELYEMCEEGKVRCAVATFQLVKEGINVKSWNRGFAVTSTADRTECIQAIGRIRRMKPGKKDAIWYDFRDVRVPKFRRHAEERLKYWRSITNNVVKLEVT